MEADPAYHPGERESPWSTARVSGRCGCIAALLFAFPVGFGMLLAVSLGDCASGVPCHEHDNRNLSAAFTIVVAFAALLGVAVRTLVRWWRLRGTAVALSAWSLLWAVPVAAILTLLAIWFALATQGLV